MPAAAAAPDQTEASCLSPIRTAASGTPDSSPRESTSHKLRSRAISSANTRRKRRSPRSMPMRRVSRRPTGSRSWRGTTSYSGSPTLRSSGSTVWSQSARPTARPQDWRHLSRSTNTSRGAKRSPRTSTRGTAISNSPPAFMPTQLATHPTSQNATIRRAKQRDSTSTCNTRDDLGAGVKMTANCSATARSAGARLQGRPTEANSPPRRERRYSRGAELCARLPPSTSRAGRAPRWCRHVGLVPRGRPLVVGAPGGVDHGLSRNRGPRLVEGWPPDEHHTAGWSGSLRCPVHLDPLEEGEQDGPALCRAHLRPALRDACGIGDEAERRGSERPSQADGAGEELGARRGPLDAAEPPRGPEPG